MADKSKDSKTKRLRVRKTETVREKAEKARVSTHKPRRVRSAISKVGKPFLIAREKGRREIYLPLPDNRVGRFLNKRRSFVPKYFKEAWAELRQVTWPGRAETWKLTLAVFMFAIIFGLLVAVVDFGLDRLFKQVILN